MTVDLMQLILWMVLAVNILILIGLAVLIFRAAPQVTGLIDLRSDIERLDRTVQANDARSFTNAEGRGDSLRKEVADNIERLSEQLTRNLAAVGGAQEAQLVGFATTLATSNQAFDARLALNAEQQQKTLSDFGLANAEGGRALRDEVANRLKSATDELRTASESAAALQKERLDELSGRLTMLSESIAQGLEQFRVTTEAKFGELRQETAEGLKTMRQDNEQKLEQIRVTVDEKLQGTLEKRLGESFTLVTQQLKQVHEGLGEMKSLATGVGDLKRVFTNVKSRGTWGETQLASVLEDMLAPDQYARNVKVKEGSNDTVEFCVKIPLMGEHDEPLLLPIDAKFPIEDYERMLGAAESGDAAGAEQSAQKLEARFRSSAKEIGQIRRPAADDRVRGHVRPL
jgi:DNA recombination protein RmuC